MPESNLFDFKPDWQFGSGASSNFVDELASGLNKGVNDFFHSFMAGDFLGPVGGGGAIDEKANRRRALNQIHYESQLRALNREIQEGADRRRQKEEDRAARAVAKSRQPEIKPSPRSVVAGSAVGLTWKGNVAEIGRENIPELAPTFDSLFKAGFVQTSATALARRKTIDDPGAVQGLFKFEHPAGHKFELYLFGNTGELKKEGVLKDGASPISRTSDEAAARVKVFHEETRGLGIHHGVDSSEVYYNDTAHDGRVSRMGYTEAHGAEQSILLQDLALKGRGSVNVAPLPIDLVPGTKHVVELLKKAGFAAYDESNATVDRDGNVMGGYKMHKGSLVVDIALSGDNERVLDTITISGMNYDAAPLLAEEKDVQAKARGILNEAGAAADFIDMVKTPVLYQNADGSTQRSVHSITGQNLRKAEQKAEKARSAVEASKSDVSLEEAIGPDKPQPQRRSYDVPTVRLSLTKDGAAKFELSGEGSQAKTWSKKVGKGTDNDQIAWAAIRAVESAAESGLKRLDIELVGKPGEAALAAGRDDEGKSATYLYVAKKVATDKGIELNIRSEEAPVRESGKKAAEKDVPRAANQEVSENHFRRLGGVARGRAAARETNESILESSAPLKRQFAEDVAATRAASPSSVALAAAAMFAYADTVAESKGATDTHLSQAFPLLDQLAQHPMADDALRDKIAEHKKDYVVGMNPEAAEIAQGDGMRLQMGEARGTEEGRINAEYRPNMTEAAEKASTALARHFEPAAGRDAPAFKGGVAPQDGREEEPERTLADELADEMNGALKKRMKEARDLSIGESVQKDLAGDGDYRVRAALAGNESIGLDIQTALAGDDHGAVLTSLANNEAVTDVGVLGNLHDSATMGLFGANPMATETVEKVEESLARAKAETAVETIAEPRVETETASAWPTVEQGLEENAPAVEAAQEAAFENAPESAVEGSHPQAIGQFAEQAPVVEAETDLVQEAASMHFAQGEQAQEAAEVSAEPSVDVTEPAVEAFPEIEAESIEAAVPAQAVNEAEMELEPVFEHIEESPDDMAAEVETGQGPEAAVDQAIPVEREGEGITAEVTPEVGPAQEREAVVETTEVETGIATESSPQAEVELEPVFEHIEESPTEIAAEAEHAAPEAEAEKLSEIEAAPEAEAVAEQAPEAELRQEPEAAIEQAPQADVAQEAELEAESPGVETEQVGESAMEQAPELDAGEETAAAAEQTSTVEKELVPPMEADVAPAAPEVETATEANIEAEPAVETEHEAAAEQAPEAEMVAEPQEPSAEQTAPSVPQYFVEADAEKGSVGLSVEDTNGEMRAMDFDGPAGYDQEALSAFGVGQAVNDAHTAGYDSIAIDGENMPGWNAQGQAGAEMGAASMMAEIDGIGVELGAAERVPMREMGVSQGQGMEGPSGGSVSVEMPSVDMSMEVGS